MNLRLVFLILQYPESIAKSTSEPASCEISCRMISSTVLIAARIARSVRARGRRAHAMPHTQGALGVELEYELQQHLHHLVKVHADALDIEVVVQLSCGLRVSFGGPSEGFASSRHRTFGAAAMYCTCSRPSAM